MTSESAGSLARIDPSTGSVIETINVGNGPAAVEVGAGSVWVANSFDGTVSRIDPQTDENVKRFGGASGPISCGLLVAAGTRRG